MRMAVPFRRFALNRCSPWSPLQNLAKRCQRLFNSGRLMFACDAIALERVDQGSALILAENPYIARARMKATRRSLEFLGQYGFCRLGQNDPEQVHRMMRRAKHFNCALRVSNAPRVQYANQCSSQFVSGNRAIHRRHCTLSPDAPAITV